MNAERVRTFLLTLPHVVETAQWGGLIFWVGDKAIGGKMFVMLDLEGPAKVIAYPATPERYAELIERDGFFPAPYLAWLSWVAAQSWIAHSETAWEDELRAAHTLTLQKLSPKTRAAIELPTSDRKRLIADRRRLLADRRQALLNRKQATNPPTPKSKPPKPAPSPGRPTKASKATSLASASKAGKPKRHRQS